jgi:hypothetical protein
MMEIVNFSRALAKLAQDANVADLLTSAPSFTRGSNPQHIHCPWELHVACKHGLFIHFNGLTLAPSVSATCTLA